MTNVLTQERRLVFLICGVDHDFTDQGRRVPSASSFVMKRFQGPAQLPIAPTY